MSSAHDLFKYMAGKIMADDVRKALDAIDDKPECDHSVELENAAGIPSCEVMYKCPKCQEYVTGKLKPEKIEMPEVNITKYGIVHSKEMRVWMQQITKAVNSLKERE